MRLILLTLVVWHIWVGDFHLDTFLQSRDRRHFRQVFLSDLHFDLFFKIVPRFPLPIEVGGGSHKARDFPLIGVSPLLSDSEHDSLTLSFLLLILLISLLLRLRLKLLLECFLLPFHFFHLIFLAAAFTALCQLVSLPLQKDASQQDFKTNRWLVFQMLRLDQR